MGIEVLKAKDIHKRFGALEVLRGISLEIAPHAVTAIVGASGAGKTTLLQVLGTLERPDSGEVGEIRLHQAFTRARVAQAHGLETSFGGKPPHHGAPEHARGASHDNFHGAIVP